MKKIIAILVIPFFSITARAQDFRERLPQGSAAELFVRVFVILLLFSIGSFFVITVVRLILDHRLKTKIVARGVPENIVTQLLNTGKPSFRNNAFKWFIILCSLGIGLLLASFFQPLGLHSLVMLVFSISAGFLAYFLYLKRNGDE